MTTKLLCLLLAGTLLALAAWFVHGPNDPPSAAAAELDDERIHEVPEKYRDTVQRGLEYLAKQQHDDGHWEGDGGQHPVAMTGLAGLALFMENNRPNLRTGGVSAAKYEAKVRKAVDWLLSQVRRDGLIFSEHPSETARYMEGHGLATLLLAGVCEGERNDERRQQLGTVLARAVKYIVNAQSSQGGWYHTSRVEGHDFDTVAATAIQVQALQAAENAGIPVPSAALHDGQQCLAAALAKLETQAAGPSRAFETAAALACCGVGRGKADDERSTRWLEYCRTALAVGSATKLGRDDLARYYYAQALFERAIRERRQVIGESAWTSYRTDQFDLLQRSQNQDGSWPASEGISVGRTYATALWCITLQLERNRYPSIQRMIEAVK